MAETDSPFAPGARPVRPPMGQGRTHTRKIGGVGRPSVQMKYAKNTAQEKPTPPPTPAFYHVVSESTTELVITTVMPLTAVTEGQDGVI